MEKTVYAEHIKSNYLKYCGHICFKEQLIFLIL